MTTGVPNWLKPLGVVVAVLAVAVLLAGIVAVPLTSAAPPSGADQPRIHLNTKNTTRFMGGGPGEIGALVGQAVYPATADDNRPDVVLLYGEDDWQGGLAAASLLRPLNAALLPATTPAEALAALRPTGAGPLGAQLVLLNGAPDTSAVESGLTSGAFTTADVADLLAAEGPGPLHAILVDADDPATALLAAPWVAYSGDLVIFDPAEAPAGVPVYALGDLEGVDADHQIGGGSAAATAVAFATFDDPATPLFGWGMNADSLTGYRAYTLAPEGQPAIGLLSANLARRGKPGPLFWTGRDRLPQAANNYFFSQRAAFWVTPSEGPFHHFYVLGDDSLISFPAQSQADYTVEIGPYLLKGVGAGPIDMLSAAWIALGLASALWIAFHGAKYMQGQSWVLRLAWPMMALMIGPFGIPLYWLAHRRPVMRRGKMLMWDRPLWLQGMVATISAVGFGGLLMVLSGYLLTLFGAPLVPMTGPLFFLGTPMILIMIINYIAAVVISWLLYQTPMIAMFRGLPYRDALSTALPLVLISMAAAALAMNPGMWFLMMEKFPMMPTDESIAWFGTMFFTVFLAFLIAWPFNYVFVRTQAKSGLM